METKACGLIGDHWKQTREKHEYARATLNKLAEYRRSGSANGGRRASRRTARANGGANKNGNNPPIIAFIDMGEVNLNHPGLKGHKITSAKFPGKRSKSSHATEIAGLLHSYTGGNAELWHFNVWSEKGLDRKAYYKAFEAVLIHGIRVLNLSIGSKEYDPEVERLVNECIDNNVIVVAAAGDYEDSAPVYPAAFARVIGVGAVNQYDRPIRTTQYDRAFFSAPGQAIRVLQDDSGTRNQDGTSYATAYVSAAVWQILSYDSTYNQQGVFNLLHRTARKPRRIVDVSQVGYGIVDLDNIAVELGAPAAVLTGSPAPAPGGRLATPIPRLPTP